MPTSFGNLVDRTFRDWLHSPDDQPTRFVLDGAITSSATSLIYDPSTMLPEEELLLGAGVLVEIDDEQILIGSVDDYTKTISGLVRGVNGTARAAHDDQATIRLSPAYARRTVKDALASSIVALYPRLYRRRAVTVSITEGYTEIPSDAEIPESFVYFDGNYPIFPRVRIVDLPSLATGKALLTIDAPAGTSGTLVYRGRFVKPEDEDDLLIDDLGILPEYETPVIVRAVAHIVSAHDMDRLTTEYLTRQIEAQIQEPMTGARLREALLRYYEYLMAELSRNTEAVRFHNGWTRGS